MTWSNVNLETDEARRLSHTTHLAAMPNNRVKTLKAVQGKKTKVASGQVHPNSRRAKQLQRVELRAKKLEHDAKVRRVAEVHESESRRLSRAA